MSAIDLPTTPYARSAKARVQDFGGYLEPSSGGQTQRLNRMGSRYAVAFEMPPLDSKEGRIWVNRLVRGQREGVRLEYPLLDFDPGVPGVFTVNGAGQSGTSLVIEGGTPRYAFKEGQPFSMIVNGQSYLDFIAEPTITDGSGNATITLSQMLRVSPTDGAVLNFARPIIEGFVMGDQLSWELSVERLVGLSFEIVESR